MITLDKPKGGCLMNNLTVHIEAKVKQAEDNIKTLIGSILTISKALRPDAGRTTLYH